MKSPHRLRAIGRHPIVRFVAAGALLFALRTAWRPAEERAPAPATRAPIVITAERVRFLESDFRQRWGSAPTAAQLSALIEQAVEEELLYREARVLALDYKDGSVRRRLIEKARAVIRRPFRDQEELYQEALALGFDDDVVIRRLLVEKMRLFLQADAPDDDLITDAALLDYLERNRARFIQPETVTLTHMFVRDGGQRDRLAAAASRPPSAAAELSDPFPLGPQLRAYTRLQLMGRLGRPFADQVFALEPGAWSQPIASPYGLHLVWVHERLPARLPPLDAVREVINLELTKERAARNLQRGMARLRSLYEIRVAGRPAGDVAADTSTLRKPPS